MKLPRRRILSLAAVSAALAAVSRVANAQTYPTRPVTIIVGFAAGGAFDITARLIGQLLSERLSQPFVVENRPGAASNVATEAVVRARADGYTLLLVGVPAAINATLYGKLSYNFVRDITRSILENSPRRSAKFSPVPPRQQSGHQARAFSHSLGQSETSQHVRVGGGFRRKRA
jgi:hypothetical protein